MIKELKFLNNEILTNESLDKEYKEFISWMCEQISRIEDDNSTSKIIFKKIEESKAKTIDDLMRINSQTLNKMIEKYRIK